jgi:archaellum component FlaF (FlaF/FlaG flagellin family)
MKNIFLAISFLVILSVYSKSNNEKMNFETTNNLNLSTRIRVIDLNIMTPNIRAEFYVRLYSLLNSNPEISYEGYEFYIKDTETGLEFSAALTGFGVGYFAENKSTKTIDNINKFNNLLFSSAVELKDCKIEVQNDFGKSIFGFENDKIIDIDIEDE